MREGHLGVVVVFRDYVLLLCASGLGLRFLHLCALKIAAVLHCTVGHTGVNRANNRAGDTSGN
jgi:hypothetical protein